MPKVFHILDMAGQGSILSHFLNKYTLITSQSYYVKKGSHIDMINNYYNSTPFKNIKHLLYNIIKKKFNIAHIHSAEILVPLFKLLGKKVVLHYHGSDINMPSRKNSKLRRLCRDMADIILYNDKDMTIPTRTKCVYFPDIIDTDLFKNNNQQKEGSLIMVSNNLNIQETIKNIPKTTIIQNHSDNHVEYSKMPHYLSQFQTYIDEKVNDKGQRLNAFSNTGLQAMACGLTVVKGGQTYYELPKEHHPHTVIENLIEIYKNA